MILLNMSTLPLAAIHYPHINPILFQFGPFAVRWYGLAYLAGFVAGYLWLQAMIRRRILRIPAPALADLVTWLVIGVIVGGRAGWWIFYHHGSVVSPNEPWYEPLAIWRGGMAFHGALLGVAIVMLIWTRHRKFPFWNLADCAALVTPVGLFFGRIANFINAELWGRVTSVPWAVYFPQYPVEPGQPIVYMPQPRHPSQLYEAMLEGPVLLAFLWAARRFLRLREGQIGALFILLYGVIRFGVEFTREPDAQLGFIAFGWLTMGQLLSFVIILIGAALYVWRGRASDLPAARALAEPASAEKKPATKTGQQTR